MGLFRVLDLGFRVCIIFNKHVTIFSITTAFIILFIGNLFAFENIRYDILCDIEPEDKTIKAQETITFKNNTNQDLKEIYFRIYPNRKFSRQEINSVYKYSSYLKINPFPGGFNPGNFQIQSINQENINLEYEIEGEDETVLRIALKEPLKISESIQLNIDFSLKIPHRYGRYGWHNNIIALHRWYPILSVFDEEGWHNDPDYLFQLPYFSEAAKYSVELTLPKEYTVVFGGELKSEKGNLDGKKTILIEGSAPLRDFSLAVSNDYKAFSIDYEGIKINSFYLKGDEFSAKKAAEFAMSMIKYYSNQFGPYPYNQFSIAPVYLGYGGNQCSGMIFIDTRFYKLPKFLIRYFDNLIAHETGHQWWYNIVGNNKYKEIWLEEGIDVYWLSKYIKDKYGEDAKVFEFPKLAEFFIPNLYFERLKFSRYYSLVKNGLDSSVVGELTSFNEANDIFAITYGKGSGIIHMLSSLVGEDKLLEIMQAYFNKFYFKNTKIKDFIEVCNEVSGQNLTWFFNQWLYTQDYCDYTVKNVNKEKIIIQKSGNALVPVETRLSFRDGKEIIDYWDGKDKIKEINLPKDNRLKSVYLDFENKILDFDKINNHFPVEVDIKLVPLYFGVYEVPVFLKEDAYSWITGPEFSQYGFGLKSSFQKPDDYIFYAGSYYDSNAQNFNSAVGFRRQYIFAKPLSLGFEFLNRDAHAEEEDDLKSYKLYLTKDLNFSSPSIFQPKNQIGLYLVHNQRLGSSGFLNSQPEIKNLRYRQTKESIVGWDYFYSQAGPLTDPVTGYQIIFNQENAGHFLGGKEYFIRSSLELDKYLQISPEQKLALRLKAGGAHPKDKYLFYLGSDEELRGYDYKDIKGSSILLGSIEYRFPLVNNINHSILGNILNLNRIQAVTFFDIGKAWFDNFNEAGFKKDIGLGLRFYFNVIVPIEEFILRIDFARPISGEDKDTHIWVGINHAF